MVSGGDLLVEAAQVLVLLGLGGAEGAGKDARDGDLAGRCDCLGGKDCMALPGNSRVLGRAFHAHACGQVVDNLIDYRVSIMHINRLEALFLIDEGMAAAGLKEEAGQKQAF